MQKYGKIKELGEAVCVCKGFSFLKEVIENGVSEPSPVGIHLLVHTFACLKCWRMWWARCRSLFSAPSGCSCWKNRRGVWLVGVPLYVHGRNYKAEMRRCSGTNHLSEVEQCLVGLYHCLRQLLFRSAADLLVGYSRTWEQDGEKNTQEKWKNWGLIHLYSQIGSTLRQSGQEWHGVIWQGYRYIAFCQAEPMCLHFPAHWKQSLGSEKWQSCILQVSRSKTCILKMFF